MITFWTGCKDEIFNNVIKKTLKEIGPGIEFTKVSFKEDKMYYPQKGEIVLAMGEGPYELLQKDGRAPKNKGIGTMRGVLVPHTIEKKNGSLLKKGSWMISYDPTDSKTDLKKIPDIKWDIRLAERVHRTGTLNPELENCEYEYVGDFSETIQYIKDKYEDTEKIVDVALDTETMGLNPFDPKKKIVCIQITVEPGQAHVYYMLGAKNKNKVIKQLDWLLTTKKVSLKGANLKYDLLWLRVKCAVVCTNFKFDTLLVGSLLNENRSNGLSGHSKEFTSIGGYDNELESKYDKAYMEKVPKKDLLQYSGGDTDACLRVSIEFRKSLKNNTGLQYFYKHILHPACRVFEDVEYQGLCVDVDQFKKVRKKVKKEEEECIQKLIDMMPRRLKLKHAHRANLLVPVVLREFLFTPYGLNLKPEMVTPKKKEPTISHDHLMMFLDNPDAREFVQTYKRLNSAQKTINTFIDGFLNHLRSDGKFHPTYALYVGGLFENKKDSGTNCFTGDTLFNTQIGVIPFYDLSIGDEVISHTGKVRKITDKIYNGIKPVFQVTLTNGLSLKCTENHPFYTKEGWTNCEYLKFKQKVFVASKIEKWKKLKEWPYEVSSWGRVRNFRTKNILKQYQKNKWGHLKVSLSRYDSKRKTGNRKDFSTHRLIAGAFLENKDNLPETRHLNGIAWDNRIENLRWGTSKDNSKDAIIHGYMDRTQESRTKLNWDLVKYIRSTNKPQQEIANELGVSRELIRDVRNHKRWIEEKIKNKKVEFFTSTISDIELIGHMPTYGISVEEDESHITEGIVTHNTGRTSATGPAIQTLPSHTKWAKLLRSCYPAPSGYVVFSIDFSEGELRLVACAAEEDVMLDVYNKGMSLHAMTGSRLAGYSLEEFMSFKGTKKKGELFDTFRFKAKGNNFGCVYGMQAKGYREYVRTGFDLELSLAEAEDERNLFFNTYPGLDMWHIRCVTIAEKQKRMISPLGRIRHLPLIDSNNWVIRSKEERRAINAPIQSTLSDLCLWSMVKIRKRFSMEEVWIAGMTHDSIYGYISEGHYKERLVEIKNIMENLPLKERFQWEPQIPFPVDVEISHTHLGELEGIHV